MTEVRVLHELAHRDDLTATALARKLTLDRGYLSRILKNLEGMELLRRTASKTDARQHVLSLTSKGRQVFSPLEAPSAAQVEPTVGRLTPADLSRLIEAMRTIESILGTQTKRAEAFILRPHRPGDIGWVVQSQGAFYATEYGWNSEFEALVAELTARFLRNFDPNRERCWIVEHGGRNAGSVFLVKKSRHVGQLRMLFVDQSARGLGAGRALVDECVRFARTAGYRKVVLWTNDILHAARRLYQDAGFRLVKEEPHHSFGHDLVGQTWELKL